MVNSVPFVTFVALLLVDQLERKLISPVAYIVLFTDVNFGSVAVGVVGCSGVVGFSGVVGDSGVVGTSGCTGGCSFAFTVTETLWEAKFWSTPVVESATASGVTVIVAVPAVFVVQVNV